MQQENAEKIITGYLKPIYGFALKRCSNIQDAEDLSQDIVLKAFKALIARDSIESPDKFIWTVAHNALANYYRDRSRSSIGVPVDELADILPSDEDIVSDLINRETVSRLHSEIAYLSKLQRKIVVAYYFENKTQNTIASELGLPLGTVKWHLFEAKKDLKKGMDTMRTASELKFNPIKFHSVGMCGNCGTTPPENFFRSALSQNIAYCVRHRPMTVNEIADALGVSPVYVEGEAEYLEEYGFLVKQKDKYLINFIISECSSDFLMLQDEMYKKAADIFANELYDELISSGSVDSPDILCGQTDGSITLRESKRADRNFIMWSLIPYIAAQSGEEMMDAGISFDEAATIRPDGGHNICHASVISDNICLPDDYVYMKNWCGPCWHATEKHTLWQIDSEWSDKRVGVNNTYAAECGRVLSLYEREFEDVLSKDEYVWLAQRGFVKTNGDYDGYFKSAWQVVTFSGREIVDRLLEIGGRIKKRHKAEFEAIKAPYVKAALEAVPEHLRRVREYELQFTFYSDGWFLCHCISTLLKNGKLSLPTAEQKKSLSTLIIPNK